MLQQLYIENYAIIDKLSIEFASGLNIITGETGAGKSILIGALNLILGARADNGVLMDREKKCIVEGHFIKANEQIENFLKKHELSEDNDELIIRREIAPNNKSRVFINDTPTSNSILKELSGLLVDLHQQFDTMELSDKGFQRQVLDALANNGKLLAEYNIVYKSYLSNNKELDELKKLQQGADKEMDYNRFLLDELNDANFKVNEIEETESNLKQIENAEQIKSTLSEISAVLVESDKPIVQVLKSQMNQLQSIQNYQSQLPEIINRIRTVQIELQDIADDIERINNQVSVNAAELEGLNERLSLGYRLYKKHGVNSTSELLDIQKQLDDKMQQVLNLSETIASKEKLTENFKGEAIALAQKITDKRKAQVDPFVKKVNELLAKVGMPNARIAVQLTAAESLNNYGADQIEFLFDANKSGRFEPLKKVASGGELSRLMLNIKSLVAKSVQLPTLIFDEIDSGISGEAAKQVGIIMKELSLGHQIIAITHQAQIAARASSHYFIYKQSKNDRIITSVKLLSPQERINAIATMLSGEKPTAAAFANAKEMIEA